MQLTPYLFVNWDANFSWVPVHSGGHVWHVMTCFVQVDKVVRKTKTAREGPSSNQPQELGYYRGITDSCISRPWTNRFLSVRKPFITGWLGEGKRGRRLVVWRGIRRIHEGVTGTSQQLAFRNFIIYRMYFTSGNDLIQIKNYFFPEHMKWETNVWF
jgi:hypothetical protein